MNSNTRQKISNDDTATRALRIVLQQQDLSSRLDVCEALQQQATSKDFALSRPGFATVTCRSEHGRLPKPIDVDARLARRLAKALVSGDSATRDGDGQSFSAIWAARAAERACVACCVLQRATAPLVEAGVPAALVYALRCAVEATDARAQPELYAATIAALLNYDNFPSPEPDEETGYRGIDDASRLEISNQLIQAGFLQVVSTVATTRGEETSELRSNVFYAFQKLTLLSWPSLYGLPAKLVSNLLELTAASMPDPDGEQALTALHTIVRTHGKSDEVGYEGPGFKFPLETLVGLVAPRGLSILADVIKCGAAEPAFELLIGLARCDPQRKGVPSAFCRAIAESSIIDSLLEIISYEDEDTRAYLSSREGNVKRIHSGFFGSFTSFHDPRPLALDLLRTLIDFHGFGDGERLRPAIAPIVRVLRLTCQEGAQFGPDTYNTRLHGLNILARLCGTKYRLSRDVLRQGGLDAATLVLENLKLPGSTATPRLLRVAIHDAIVPLFALAAAGHLASVQAALAASSVQPSLTDLVTGNAQEAHYATGYRLELTHLKTCNAEEWAEDLLTGNIAQYAVALGTN
mmetsp:Transcript_24858/g.64515  ORF Transcript_24858/g.64515 Transcript_24858/m.64515 type:complete len:579 (-) Transcript_24858:42-1778(-)